MMNIPQSELLYWNETENERFIYSPADHAWVPQLTQRAWETRYQYAIKKLRKKQNAK